MKKAILATAVAMAATGVQADLGQGEDGFSFSGDIEINLDARSFETKKSEESNSDENLDLGDDSRILLEGNWLNSLENGNFITAKGQALVKTNGNVEVDDAYFAMGKKQDWFFQIGRYEAIDLFPMGKDVAVQYAQGGDSVGGGIYVYRGHEARGRAGNAGQARISKEMGGLTAEVSTIYGEATYLTDLSEDYQNSFKDLTVTSNGSNSFMIRPAVNYTTADGFLSLSLGGEFDTRNDSTILTFTENNTARDLDMSNRYGVASTATMNFGALKWNINTAYQNAEKAWEAFSFATNIDYMEKYGLGMVYAKNDLHKDYPMGDGASPENWTVYAAYSTPLMGFDNALVSFGLSYSETKNAFGEEGREDDAVMFRTRFNYYF